MRIFIYNADTFLGKAIVKELRMFGPREDRNFNRMFGTSLSGPENVPKAVKRVVGREDPKRAKKMAETIQSCGLVVMDLFSCTMEDLHFAIRALKVDPTASPPKQFEELGRDMIFVLISSVMVWAGTTPQAEDGFLSEAEYADRTPVSGSKYEQWKEMEDLVMNCFNMEGSTVKGLIVAGGVLYGNGEETLCPLFKDAWRGIQEHVILTPGTNRIPTVHARDLGRLVRQVSFAGEGIVASETPYFIAVDQPPAPEEEQKPQPSTQAEVVQGIVDEVCEQYDVPIVPVPVPASGDSSEAPDELQEAMLLDLLVEPSKLMLDPEFAKECDPPGWFCKEGLVANMRKIAGEFCEARKLQAMRVIIAGPPASGKTTLANAVSEHFRIPRLEVTEDLEGLAASLSSKVCRYRGYVLDAGSMTHAEAERLFCKEDEAPPSQGEDDEEAEPPAAEGEEGEEGEPREMKRRLNEEICPAFAVVTQAPAPLCRARWQARGTGTLDEFQQLMDDYVAANLAGNEATLMDFFQDTAKIGVLNLPIGGKDPDDMFESTRIYMEKSGRPFNYLPTEEEVAAEILARRAEQEEADAELARADSKGAPEEAERHAKRAADRHAKRLQLIARHEEEQQKLMELPLREYLMRYMVPCLTEGLIEICKVLPENPVDYLATYLEEHAADEHNVGP